MENKFKEFWFQAHHNDPTSLVFVLDNPDSGGIHVIEYTALESANAEINALKAELNEYDPNLPEEKSRLLPKRFIDDLKLAFELASAENAKLREELANLKSDREHLETVNNTWTKRDELLQSEITNLKEEKQRLNKIILKELSENTKLRVALEEIVTLSEYAGRITKDVEHYMTMRVASRAPKIAREALNYIYGGIND